MRGSNSNGARMIENGRNELGPDARSLRRPERTAETKGPEAGGMGPHMDICHFPVLVCADIPQSAYCRLTAPLHRGSLDG